MKEVKEIINTMAKHIAALDEKAKPFITETGKQLTQFKEVRDSDEYSVMEDYFYDTFITAGGNPNYVLLNAAEEDGRFTITHGEVDRYGWLSALVKTPLGTYLIV